MVCGGPEDIEGMKESMLASPYIYHPRTKALQNGLRVTPETVTELFDKSVADVISQVQHSFWCVPQPNEALRDLIAGRVTELDEVPPSKQAAC